jgi:hypothetical protein
MKAFQHCGYRRVIVDFSRGPEEIQPLLSFLTCQWDTKLIAGHPINMAPGVFLENRPASTASTVQIATQLGLSTLRALLKLANVLDCRLEEGDLSYRVVRWQLCTLESQFQLLQDLATTANLEGFEGMAAEDLAQASHENFTLLELFLRERHVIAALALRTRLAQRFDLKDPADIQKDIFAHILTVTCSMFEAAIEPSSFRS